MKRIQKLIPIAIEAVEQNIASNKKVNEKFIGYISSFGASITSAGLLPSLVFYNQKGESKANRTSIIPAIEQILRKHNQLNDEDTLIDKVKGLVENNQSVELEFLTEKILDAVIALKLAIRTFEQTKN